MPSQDWILPRPTMHVVQVEPTAGDSVICLVHSASMLNVVRLSEACASRTSECVPRCPPGDQAHLP